MIVKTLCLWNFRPYREFVVELDPRVNMIVGPNAVGKTTLLEALYYFIGWRSFRTKKNKDLIHQGETVSQIEVVFEKQGIEQRLKVLFEEKEKRIFHNNTLCPNIVNLLGILQGVLITPAHADLIKGPPASRRHFLDLQIALIDPLYVYHLSRYLGALKQRNALLRNKTEKTIESWEEQMATSGAFVILRRAQTLNELEPMADQILRRLTGGKEKLHLQYKSCIPIAEEKAVYQCLLAEYAKNRQKEMVMEATLFGPHREDFTISIEEREVRQFGSEGQQRSCAAALKLAEWDRIKNRSSENPLLLIDDVGMGLDENRKEALLEEIFTRGQGFLTATEPFCSLAKARVIKI